MHRAWGNTSHTVKYRGWLFIRYININRKVIKFMLGQSMEPAQSIIQDIFHYLYNPIYWWLHFISLNYCYLFSLIVSLLS